MNAKIEAETLMEEPQLRRAYVRALSETLGSSNLKTTMQYLLMIYEGEKWPALPAQERRRVANECETWHQDLVVRGIAVVGAGLHPPPSACVVREKQGQPVVSDGPFVETKEVLGGFEMIQCRDRSEAIAVAQTFPALRVGFTVEVRVVLSDEDFEKMIGV
jgi:hypothetical protein